MVTVLVGPKPIMSYVTQIVVQLTEGTSSVSIKARGKSISKAVDIAEIVKTRFVDGLRSDVTTRSDMLTNHGKKVRVSSIEIVLKK